VFPDIWYLGNSAEMRNLLVVRDIQEGVLSASGVGSGFIAAKIDDPSRTVSSEYSALHLRRLKRLRAIGVDIRRRENSGDS